VTSKVAKTLELDRPQHRIRYRIQYSMRYRMRYMIFSSKTGASVPRPLLIDSNEDREMDFKRSQ
jgi:hypothetical protein